mgnify:CR=1 FL=1
MKETDDLQWSPTVKIRRWQWWIPTEWRKLRLLCFSQIRLSLCRNFLPLVLLPLPETLPCLLVFLAFLSCLTSRSSLAFPCFLLVSSPPAATRLVFLFSSRKPPQFLVENYFPNFQIFAPVLFYLSQSLSFCPQISPSPNSRFPLPSIFQTSVRRRPEFYSVSFFFPFSWLRPSPLFSIRSLFCFFFSIFPDHPYSCSLSSDPEVHPLQMPDLPVAFLSSVFPSTLTKPPLFFLPFAASAALFLFRPPFFSVGFPFSKTSTPDSSCQPLSLFLFVGFFSCFRFRLSLLKLSAVPFLPQVFFN